MSRWTILDGVTPATPGDLKLKLQIQYVSDAYKSMQSRLDGYRSAAGAIFLAVIASSLTFDSGFIRFLIDPSSVKNLKDANAGTLPHDAVAGAGVLVVLIGLASLVILWRLGVYFAEMTSIVYKIDAANEAWTPGVFIENEPLYPHMFKANDDADVARDFRDRPLRGWHDPAIGMYFWITAVVTGGHVFLYWKLAAALSGP